VAGDAKTRFTVAVAWNPEYGGRGPRPAWFKWYVLSIYPGHRDTLPGHFNIERHWASIFRKLSRYRVLTYRAHNSAQQVEVHVVDETFWFVVVPYDARWLSVSTFPRNKRLLAEAFERCGFAVRTL
jgi:hypothetical protein